MSEAIGNRKRKAAQPQELSSCRLFHPSQVPPLKIVYLFIHGQGSLCSLEFNPQADWVPTHRDLPAFASWGWDLKAPAALPAVFLSSIVFSTTPGTVDQDLAQKSRSCTSSI